MKKWGSLLLAFTLCLSLTVPAMAAGADGLTAAEAKSYLLTLNSFTDNLDGIVHYADLLDMDKNGKPEMVVITLSDIVDEESFENANIHVWTVKNGVAVNTAKEEDLSLGSAGGSIYKLTTADGRTYIWHTNISVRYGNFSLYETCIGANGIIENFQIYYGWNENGPAVEYYRNGKKITSAEYFDFAVNHGRSKPKPDSSSDNDGGLPTDVYAKIPDNELVTGDFYWYSDPDPDQFYDAWRVGTLLIDAAGTVVTGNNTCQIQGMERDGSQYTLVFETTGVEKRTFEYYTMGDDQLWSQGTEKATLIQVRPGSVIKLTGGVTGVDVQSGTINGNKSTMTAGASHSILSGSVECLFPRGNEVYRFPTLKSNDGSTVYITLGKVTPTVGGFTDVPVSEYYAKPVEWAVKKKITSGTSETTFSPNSTCTNAQILTFLWKASGSPEPKISNPFSNVKTSDYYYKPALWAYQNGMVSGKTFNSNDPCTRSQTMMYMWQSAGKPTTKNTVSFTDVSSNASYAKAVAWAVKEGITAGTSATTFSPNTTCTRGQIVTFLHKYFG